MIFKDFKDCKLSALGMGTMRLPLLSENGGDIDEKATAEMIDYALINGINYFDTAWGYHNGKSETVMGKLLSHYPRESFYLATKFPGYDTANAEKVEEIFEKQLEKCQVDYFDFYLLHSLNEQNIEIYMDEKYGICDYLLEQKAKGRIRHLGFSTHASMENNRRFLEKYGNIMEFGQIQLNYLDWSFQDAKAKVELLNGYHIPVWVMEPLRGGKLATLPEKAQEVLHAMRPDEEIPAWAFRFLQTIPGVTMILSGMSDFEQVKNNIETFRTERPLTGQEMQTLLSLADGILEGSLACTACRYCTSYCPQGLDIPSLIHCFNEHDFGKDSALHSLPSEKLPTACLSCGKCAKVCPQNINIPGVMKKMSGLI